MSAMDSVLAQLSGHDTQPAPAHDTQAGPVYKRPARELFASPAPAPILKRPAQAALAAEVFRIDERPGDPAGAIVVWPSGYARLDRIPVNEAAPDAYADERRRGAELRTPLHWAKAGSKRQAELALPKLRTSFPYPDAGKSRSFDEALAELGKVIARTDTSRTGRHGQTDTERTRGRRLFPGWRILATNGHVAIVESCADAGDPHKPIGPDPGFYGVSWMLGPSWQAYAHVRAAARDDAANAWITLTWAPAPGRTLGAELRGEPAGAGGMFTAHATDPNLGTEARSWAHTDLADACTGPVSIRIQDRYLWPFRGTDVTVWAGHYANRINPTDPDILMLTDGPRGVVIMGARDK